MTLMPPPHASVLLHEILSFFDELVLTTFVDGTLGAGGHSEGMLKAHPELKHLIGIDQDPLARMIAQERLAPWKDKVTIVPGNFLSLKRYLTELNVGTVDGMILDLGVSSMQFDLPEKGFSFMREGPLDMRMDPTNPLTAAEILNAWPEAELGRLFRDYGEEKRWRAAARSIVMARKAKPITTTTELVDILCSALPPNYKKRINPATLVFQALRIRVNDELHALETVLPTAIECLAPGGRLAVISFHSLEDRIVKNYMRLSASDKWTTSGIGGMFLDKEPIVNIVTRRPVIPSDDEIQRNPRSRSAKLRVVEKR